MHIRGHDMDNRRKTFVINKQFQYQYSLLVVALTILGTNIFLIIQMLFPGEQPLSITTKMAVLIGGIELMVILAVWYGSLKLTHRIAGPVYVISRCPIPYRVFRFFIYYQCH